MAADSGGTTSGSSDLVVGDRYRIDPDSPVPELTQPGVDAFVAHDSKDDSRSMFARLCAVEVIPRTDCIVQLRGLQEAHVMHPSGWGTVYWEPERQRRFAIVFDRPPSGPLMRSLNDRITPLSFDILRRDILGPAADTLEILGRRGLTHRAIRPDNMFLGSESGDHVMLGDFVSAPPGWLQPTALEPVDLAMVPRWGRGPGRLEDDIYALGVSLLILSLGCRVARTRRQLEA